MTPAEVQQHILESNTKWVSPTTLQEALDKKEIQIKSGTVRINTETGKIELPETYLQESAVELNEELSQEPKSRVKDDASDSMLAYARRVAAERGPRQQQQQEHQGTVKTLTEAEADAYRVKLSEAFGVRPSFPVAKEEETNGCTDHHLKLLGRL